MKQNLPSKKEYCKHKNPIIQAFYPSIVPVCIKCKLPEPPQPQHEEVEDWEKLIPHDRDCLSTFTYLRCDCSRILTIEDLRKFLTKQREEAYKEGLQEGISFIQKLRRMSEKDVERFCIALQKRRGKI